jgi:hypothetical protein
MVRVVAQTVPVDQQVHAFAMLAKESIFKAQDALHEMDRDSKIARSMERRLGKIRSDLEALDREWRTRRGGNA